MSADIAIIREHLARRTPKLNPITAAVFLSLEIHPRIKLVAFDDIPLQLHRRYLIKGLIPRIGMTIVWGAPKSGKSFWVFDAVMHVALGREYRGRRVQQGPVVYCAFEGQSGLEARVQAFRLRFLDTEPGPVPFYLQPATLDLVADHAALINVIRWHDLCPAAVVLDTVNRSLRGSESSDEDMSAYVRAADAIREAFGCAVILVHHCGIEGTRPRGHTSLTGACDAQIAVKRDAVDNISATVELAKDGPQGDVILSRLEVEEVGHDEDGEPITSCVIIPVDGDAVAGSARVRGAARIALDLLQKAIDEVGEPSPSGPNFPATGQTIGLSEWRSYCDAGTVAKSDNPDNRRRSFVRLAEKLQSLGLIGVWANRVWLIEPNRTCRT
jgi:hypothetical protein